MHNGSVKKNNIIPQMFDVRPVEKTGDLDWKKIKSIGKQKDWRLDKAEFKEKFPDEQVENIKCALPDEECTVVQFGKAYRSEDLPIFQEYFSEARGENEAIIFRKNHKEKSYPNFFRFQNISFSFGKAAFSFAALTLFIATAIGLFVFFGKGKKIESSVLGESQQAYDNILSAVKNAGNQDFQKSAVEFDNAYQNFYEASENFKKIGSALVDASRFIPFTSKLFSGKSAVEAGKHLALAGKSLNGAAAVVASIENPLKADLTRSDSFLDIFRKTENQMAVARDELVQAESYLEKIRADDLPKEKRNDFISLKNNLTPATDAIDKFLKNSHIFVDLLGGNGSRKYLFLFQNNQEMRATGGFIGSYGLLDILNGKVKKFFIDGIFNPDGQLKEKIVPPLPIQKVSAAWSLHDSNWFPDFPVSAEKAILFYEKTGGPTADGIITLTPTVMEKFLEITGPVEMPEYGVTLTAENFIQNTQYEVEIDYDREKNEPKKILADLAPIILEKIFSARDIKSVSKTIEIITQALDQKHILLYSQDEELQKIISSRGWAGEILETPGDYLSVINTNINGFKTDGVINEEIAHTAEIQADGTVMDTVTITRTHNGGNREFAWWNGVNADYLRVYVPEGSTLLEAEGQTRETIEPPLLYDELGFRRDPQVEGEEKNITIHEKSGTRIYTDAGKTVFANWVYVSPQEKVVLKYKYRLPFKIEFSGIKSGVSYSLLAQKQSGSIGSNFTSSVNYPSHWQADWSYPQEIKKIGNSLQVENRLDNDRFLGAVFLQRFQP